MRCVIIAGSPDINIDFLKNTIKEDDYVICADKGCLYAEKAGISPNIIIGDFDSYTENNFQNYETITLDPHKDDTDTMHSINVAFERGFTQIIILGALGGRFDHTFSNVSALQHICEKGGNGILLSERERIEFLPVGEHQCKGYKGKTFSLFPFGCDSVCVSYSGAEYPLDRYRIKSSVPIGVSNVFTSQESKIKIYDGNAILIINLSES